MTQDDSMPEKQSKASHLKEYQFKPGQSGNPAGKPPGPTLKAKLQKITCTELEDVVSVLISGNFKELHNIKDTGSVIQQMVAAVAIKIILTGDMDALDKLLNRLIGKVKDRVEYEDKTKSVIDNMNEVELIGYTSQLIVKLRDKPE